MIYRLLISFSLCTIELAAANLSGRVLLTDSRELKTKKTLDEGGVVIWLVAKDGGPKISVAGKFTVQQKFKRFHPHVLAVTVGSTVEFPNLDPIFHNAFSNFDGKVFDLGLYPPGQTRNVRFDRAGIVRLFCNIHSSMSALIVVVESPYFTTTKADGKWEIAGVPPGEYQIKIFHERSTPATLKALERTIQIPEAALELPALVVSERGYVAMPHTNKFGGAYKPADSNPIYPGTGR